jgi:hypothetical protein
VDRLVGPGLEVLILRSQRRSSRPDQVPGEGRPIRHDALVVRPGTRRADTGCSDYRQEPASAARLPDIPADRERCRRNRTAHGIVIRSKADAAAEVDDCDAVGHEFLEAESLAIEIDRGTVD